MGSIRQILMPPVPFYQDSVTLIGVSWVEFGSPRIRAVAALPGQTRKEKLCGSARISRATCLLRGCRAVMLCSQMGAARRRQGPVPLESYIVKLRNRLAVGLVCALWLGQGNRAHAQAFGYPFGFGGFGWGGWGAATPEGDLAQGLGAFAMGAGFYNQQTAIANSIDTDTVIRWNEYLHESQLAANRRRAERRAQEKDRNAKSLDAIQKRLRDNPERRDVMQGDALNVALDEIDDPRIYARALQGAQVKIGGQAIRSIPFRYAPAAITISLEQLAKGHMPAALLAPQFEADRELIKTLSGQIVAQIEEGNDPPAEPLKKLLDAIYDAEGKSAQLFARNTRERNEADRYLKALHGLVTMLKTPAIDVILAGIENRPEATLRDLLRFMSAFNLRFGAASTPQQQLVYSDLYPKLVALRDEIAPFLAKAPELKARGTEPEDFFGGMSLDDLQKKTPKS
jgi:hypothetical protein